jgi:eukaryotic-like serine/threonine-protein kinase
VYRSGFHRCPTDGTELIPFVDDPVIGSIIDGQYEVEDCVGEGAMGRVYRAHHLRLQRRRVALKILLGDLAASVTMRLRFTQEAQAASLLSHPNVVPVLDFGKDENGLLYLAMEYVDGRSLARIIAEEAPLAPDRVVALTRHLCLGLAHAHAHGLIHRDFKPDNVLVVHGPAGEVPRIADFGLAIFTDNDLNGARLTSAGTMVGTPLYTAPEQALDRGIDQRADLFGLGVTMYEMLAGCTPFDDEASPVEILQNNLSARRPRIAERVPAVRVEPRLERIVHKLLAAHRDQRFQSAQAVIDALDDLDRAAVPSPIVADNAATSKVRNPAVRARRLAIAATIAACAAVGTALLLAPARRRPDPARAERATAQPRGEVAPGPAPAPAPAVPAPEVRPLEIGGQDPAAQAPEAADPEAAAAADLVEFVDEDDEAAEADEAADEAGRPARLDRPGRAIRSRTRLLASRPGTIQPAGGPASPEASSRAPSAGGPPGREPSTTGPGDAGVTAPAAAGPGSAGGASALEATASAPALIGPAPQAAPSGPSPAATAPAGAAPAASPTPARTSSGAKPVGAEIVPRTGRPKERARPALRARADVEGLTVEGSLSDAEVRRGLERILPRLATCYRAAATRAGRDAAGVIRVSFVIGENGRAGQVRAGDGPLPGLAACVSSAMEGVRTRIAPDVGDVRVSLRVSFAPGEAR